MFKHTLLFSAALLSAQVVNAQDDAAIEDDIIEVTSMRAIAAKDVTSSVTILDELDLVLRNSPYVADQLRAVPGVGLSRSGAAGGLTQIRIRGAEANHTLVLLNGAEVSNPVTGETDFGLWSGLEVSRIEVARGEQSVLYGSDAIGGVVSITTGGEGFRASAEYGSFDTKRGQIGYANDIGEARFNLAASFFDTDGVDTSGLDGEKDGSDSLSFLGSAEVDIADDWQVGGFASYREGSVQTDPDTNFDGALDNADRLSDSEQWIVSAYVNGETGIVSHELRASAGEVVLENEADGVFTDDTTGQRTKVSYSPSITFGDDDSGVRLSGIADYEAEDYERVDTNTLFGDPNQSQSFNTFGLGAEARAHFGGVVVNGSVRRDDNDGRFENATSWRVGGAYNFDFGTKLRASIGAGVKNPTFTELFGFFPASFVGNPNLVPEKSTSWEIGIDHSFGDLSVSATYFDAELEDEIFTSFTPTFLSSPANRTGDSERSGVEVGVDWNLSDAFSFSGAATQISSSSDSGEDEIRVPEFTASAALNWASQSKDGFRAGVAVDYVGSQDDLNFGAFDPVTFAPQRVSLDSYALISASAEYPIADRFALTLRGENLLDEEVTDVFGFNGTGAGVFVGFKIR